MEYIKTTVAFPPQGNPGSNQIEGKLDTVPTTEGGLLRDGRIPIPSTRREKKMVSVDYGMKSNHSSIHH